MDVEKVPLDKKHHILVPGPRARAEDNQSRRPILGDSTAEAVVATLSYDAKSKYTKGDRVGVAIRAKQLDGWIREFLGRNPEATVLDLGCGLDGRARRIAPGPGVRWYDLDLPEVIAIRERIPALAPVNGAHSVIAASVSDPGWLDDIPRDRPVFVAAEGLLMTLTEEEVRDLFVRLVTHFPGGELGFNAFNPLALRLQRSHPAVRALGVTFQWGVDEPTDLEAWHPRLSFVAELAPVESPDIDRMGPTERLISRLMRRSRRLLRLDRLVRLRF
ncbi:class I SAM-dependent methyltransferase [Streptomyces litchfieldiae]|uniref:Class I SAM-dependent methyltransferase n=1 Tax=Streptomyces litchfieldiae TaxID=3075543 RepID=A0ABU2MPB0_9ACTN|nr:class I SAM-dependent methyltransferase [Streptomyces sp. DSM 44938]MDT0343457.1 class I SAM-dependent methyltransferase [Streptomyces sp. DSM 44938]